jgi:hypothetical protein
MPVSLPLFGGFRTPALQPARVDCSRRAGIRNPNRFRPFVECINPPMIDAKRKFDLSPLGARQVVATDLFDDLVGEHHH